MLAKIIAQHAEGGAEASWTVSWTIIGNAPSIKLGQQPPFFQSSDVIIKPIVGRARTDSSFRLRDSSGVRIFLESEEGGSRRRSEVQSDDLGSPAAFEFLLEALDASISPSAATTAATTAATESMSKAIKLVTPRGSGNIIRSNILPKRLQDLEYIEKTVAFAQPLQLFANEEGWDASTDLISCFKGAAGAVRLCDVSGRQTVEEALGTLEEELHNRLCMPLVLAGLERQTILLVEGGDSLPYRGACSAQIYEAAYSLGIDIVLLADRNHELRQPEYAHWYKEFIPVETGYDAGFPSRIVAAVRQYEGRIDAILSVFESLHVAISKAAEELGFPHEPTAAYEIATDKFRLSAFEGRNSFIAASAEEAVTIARTKSIPWPIIIKPCRGWGSELVFKLDNIQQLEATTPYMNTERHGAQFVMEHYCNGPEVDINFVMYEGEVLFWETADENPKSAEIGSDTFHEVDIYFPSQLPKNEQMTLYESIAQTLKQLGFRNGIFHCEARVDNSTMEWRYTPSGLPEMVPRQGHNGTPASWLIEINTRPPGFHQCDIIETTWGVNYWVSALVTKLPNSAERVRALSQPYRDGAQFHADMMFISATFEESKKGIWQSGDVTEELVQRRPDLAKHISKHLTLAKTGDEIPHPSTGVNKLVAYLHMFSRKSRTHLLELSAEARKDLRIKYS